MQCCIYNIICRVNRIYLNFIFINNEPKWKITVVFSTDLYKQFTHMLPCDHFMFRICLFPLNYQLDNSLYNFCHNIN